MPPRLTFLEGNRGTALKRGDGVGNGVVVRAGVRQRADQHVAADSRKCVQIASKGHLSNVGTRGGPEARGLGERGLARQPRIAQPLEFRSFAVRECSEMLAPLRRPKALPRRGFARDENVERPEFNEVLEYTRRPNARRHPKPLSKK